MDIEELLHFRISEIKQETPLARTYELDLLNKPKLEFLPGQFLTFLIKTEKHDLRRSYSILNLPGEPIKITVKKVENGTISRFILQHWEKGTLIHSLPPSGRFNLPPQNEIQRDIFCFAAGSGIIPILPQIRFLLESEPQSIIHLIYSNRDESDSLFLEEIEALAKEKTQLNLINKFSNPRNRLNEKGRLSNFNTEILINKIRRYERFDTVFLICGPFAYMRMLMFTIGLMDFKKENIKRENFIPEIMRAGQAVHKHFPDTEVKIKTRNKTFSISVKSGDNILDAALKSGIALPYSCKGGVCGNCAARCRNGKVYMSINEVLSDADLKQGWILTCTGFPEDKGLVIDFTEEL